MSSTLTLAAAVLSPCLPAPWVGSFSGTKAKAALQTNIFFKSKLKRIYLPQGLPASLPQRPSVAPYCLPGENGAPPLKPQGHGDLSSFSSQRCPLTLPNRPPRSAQGAALGHVGPAVGSGLPRPGSDLGGPEAPPSASFLLWAGPRPRVAHSSQGPGSPLHYGRPRGSAGAGTASCHLPSGPCIAHSPPPWDPLSKRTALCPPRTPSSSPRRAFHCAPRPRPRAEDPPPATPHPPRLEAPLPWGAPTPAAPLPRTARCLPRGQALVLVVSDFRAPVL